MAVHEVYDDKHIFVTRNQEIYLKVSSSISNK